MEKIEIIIRDNGTLTERTIRERDLKAEGEVLDELTADVARTQRNVLAVPGWGVAHANVGLFDTIWSVAISRIPLKARFKLVNSVLVPMFASMTDLEVPMVWTAPPEVRLVFVVRTTVEDDCVVVGGNWLFAYGKDHNGYRLPLTVTVKNGSRVAFWGLVRPAAAASPLVLQYSDNNGRSWQQLLTAETNTSGYWTASGLFDRQRIWRVEWTSPSGTVYVGAPVRAYVTGNPKPQS